MKLSRHEQQILAEIEQGVQAEDPEFFARMTGAHCRRGGTVWGSVALLSGLVAFIVAAVIAQVMPAVGVVVSLAAFMTMFWGLSLLTHSAVNERNQKAVQRRAVRLWDSLKDPPQPGMTP
jgi:hypothetical protein